MTTALLPCPALIIKNSDICYIGNMQHLPKKSCWCWWWYDQHI